MNIRYQREISHNYMIIEAPDPSAAEGFESRMLAENRVPGLLHFQVRRREDAVEYYYEITSRQPLSRILDTRRIRGREICAIVGGILQAMAGLREYLLREEQLYLEADAIYADPDSFAIGLCLIPGYRCPLPDAMTRLFRVLLEKTDHQEAEGVMIAYNLYETSLKENYGAEDLRKCLEYGRNPDGRQEKPPLPDPGPAADFMPDNVRHMSYAQSTASLYAGAVRPEENVPVPRRAKSDGKKMLKGIIPAVPAALLLLWYLAGLRAALAGGAALMLLLAVMGVYLRLRGRKGSPGSEVRTAGEGRSPARRDGGIVHGNSVHLPGSRSSAGSFRVEPESREAFREREEKEEEDRIRRGFTEGTVLLSDLPEEGSSGARLEATDGNGEVIRISYTPFVLGQHPELADYCIAHAGVSRLHARIDREEDGYRITDLNSKNGTEVNGKKLEANGTALLGDGDRVRLANQEYRFRAGSCAATSDLM